MYIIIFLIVYMIRSGEGVVVYAFYIMLPLAFTRAWAFARGNVF